MSKNNLKWFCFHQNNSGGYFIVDDNVAHLVFIQGENAEDAIARSASILEESGEDWCECCGERWYSYLSIEDGKDVPQYAGIPLSEMAASLFIEEARLHYIDDKVERVVLPKKGKKP